MIMQHQKMPSHAQKLHQQVFKDNAATSENTVSGSRAASSTEDGLPCFGEESRQYYRVDQRKD
jgi:hypothetical protein